MNKIVRDFRLIFNLLKNRIKYKDNRYFVFGEWMGKMANDNCLYLANYFCHTYSNIKIAWITNTSTDLGLLSDKIERYDISSEIGRKIVENASVVITNQGIEDISNDATLNISAPLKVNLWHGIAWKKIGYDGLRDSGFIRNIEHKYQIKIRSSDIYVSTSEEFTRILKSAFFINNKNIVKAGLPRNSLFYAQEAIKECRNKLLTRLNIDNNGTILLYLPTFRDEHTEMFSFCTIKDAQFWHWINDNDVYIIQKAHFAEMEEMEIDDINKHVRNVSNISAQELMAASDMLITDYSSCFFDYLLLDRPIIHFLYDYEYYKTKDRGLYYEKEDVVCGSAPETVPELIQAIMENYEKPELYHDLRMKRKEKFMTYETPNSCEIITQRILSELKKKGKMI